MSTVALLDMNTDISVLKMKVQENNELLHNLLSLVTSITTRREQEILTTVPNLSTNFVLPINAENDLMALEDFLAQPDGLAEKSLVSHGF